MSLKTQRGEIFKILLALITVTGIVSVGAMAPGLLQIAAPFVRRRYSEPIIKRAVKRLDEKGWIVLKQTGDHWRIDLTARGRTELLAYELGQKRIHAPRRWDQKWRVLIFDIPEKRKPIREQVRNLLRSLGFYRLQDSVWVFPYECQEILALLRTKYGIRHEALYLRVEFLDQDQWLRKEFGLKI